MSSSDRLEVVWDPRFQEYSFGPTHPFQEGPRALAVSLLRASVPSRNPSFDEVGSVEPALRSELERFHHAEYLDLVEERSRESRPRPLDDGDTPAFPGCFDAAARIVGGTLRAMRSIADGRARRAFQPSGGLHHAHPDRASGFCIFNDLAVAIASNVGPGKRFARAAYLDIDAHHGDGVMYGFYESGRLLDIDFHQDGRTLFPGTGAIRETGRGDGAGLKVNVPMPPGTGDPVLVPTFRRIVPPLLRSFRPEVLLLQHGVDGHLGDALAGLRYGPGGYVAVLDTLMELSEELCEGRLLVTGGGGYRAASVSRVLARAGVLLAGRPRPSGALPSSWREEFSRIVGSAAPERWEDPVGPSSTPEGELTSRWIVDELAEALGTSFPESL